MLYNDSEEILSPIVVHSRVILAINQKNASLINSGFKAKFLRSSLNFYIYNIGFCFYNSNHELVKLDVNLQRYFYPAPQKFEQQIFETPNLADFLHTIDEINTEKNGRVIIKGWVINSKNTESLIKSAKLTILLVSSSERYQIQVYSVNRTDLGEAFNNANYNDCGFIGLFDLTKIASGNYTIYLNVDYFNDSSVYINTYKVFSTNTVAAPLSETISVK